MVTSGRENFFTLCIVVDLKIVGVIVAVIESQSVSEFRDDTIFSMPFSVNNKVAYILVLGVVKEYRRLGLASLLINQLVVHLTSNPVHRNVKAIYLHVLTTNTDAIRLYEKNNFKCHSFLPEYYFIYEQKRDGYCYCLYINGGFNTFPYPFQSLYGLFGRLVSYCSSFVNKFGLTAPS